MTLNDEFVIRENPWRGRIISLGVLAGIAAVIAVGAYALFFRESEETLRDTEDVVVGRATINANLIISGEAEAQLLSNLTFRSTGKVETINVKVGDVVNEGDVLASLESEELTNAIASSQASLAISQARLQALLDGADEAQLAAVEQAVVAAQVALNRSQRDLQTLLDGATDVAIAVEEQAVTATETALNQAIRDRQTLLDGATPAQVASSNQVVISAEAALAEARRSRQTLLDGATDAQIANAEQAVAAAQAQLNIAQRNLTELREGPTTQQIAAAEQSVAAAEANLASAEASLDRLTAPPSDAAVAAAESQLAAAEQGLSSAIVNQDNSDSNEAAAEAGLRSAIAAYCIDEPGDPFCPNPRIPLGGGDINRLLDDLNDVATLPALLPKISAVIQTNSSFQIAENATESADEAVDAARASRDAADANLDALLEPPEALDVAAAEAAVAAAEESLALARLNLDELNQGADADDIANAEDGITSAQTALTAALTNQADLLDGADGDDIARADDNVLSAQAVVDAAIANQSDLLDGADDDDIARADDGIRAAQAAYDAALARQADLLAGADDDDIASAEDAERNAEAGLDSAEANRDETERGAKQTQIDQERQALRAAELGVQAAQIRMRNAQIISPFSGTVAAVNLTPGEFAGASGEPPIVLLTPDVLVLTMQVGETDYPNVKLDQVGVVLFDALPGVPFPFRIVELGLSPSTTQGVVTYKVGGALVIPPDGPRPAAGMRASGQIVTESRVDVIAVPLRAIRRSGGNQVVDLRQDGMVVEQVVNTGASDNNFVQVVEGLEEGDVIVIPLLVTGRSAGDEPPPTLPSGIR